MRKLGLIAAACAVVVGASAWAMASRMEIETATAKEQLGTMLDSRAPSTADAAEARFEKRLAAQTAREAAQPDVGDVDSFGRNVRWLGLLSATDIILREDCTPQPDDPVGMRCMQVNPAETFTQSTEFRDVAHMTLPGRSTNSFLCHWLTPTVVGSFANLSGYDNRTARLGIQPSLTIENEVLNAPGLVDPDTGLPLNGKVDVFLNSNHVLQQLDASEQAPLRYGASRTCIGGYLSKRQLIDFYGLSEAQATQFFRKPTTVRLNLRTIASHVSYGYVSYGIRFVGD